MTKREAELRAKQGHAVEEMRKVSDAAAAESRALTADEAESLRKIEADIDLIEASIRVEQRLAALAREAASVATPEPTPASESREERHAAAFRSFLTDPSYQPPSEFRAQAVGTGSAGGFLVPQAFSNRLEVAIKTVSPVSQVAEVVTTDSGADMPWPTVNDTSQDGELVGENLQVATQAVTFGSVTLKAWKYSSKLVPVSMELLQDAAFNVDTVLADLLGQRIGRILNKHFTTGTSSTQPQGIAPGATVGITLGAGNGTSIPVDGLIDLVTSLDPAYRANAKFMLSTAALKIIMKLKDSTNQPLWLQNYVAGAPPTIMGYEYIVNDDMPAPTANNRSVLFGDFRTYKVRAVKGIQLVRFNEKYMDFGQVAFLAFARYDGRMVDAGTGAVRCLVQSA